MGKKEKLVAIKIAECGCGGGYNAMRAAASEICLQGEQKRNGDFSVSRCGPNLGFGLSALVQLLLRLGADSNP